jgi:hypothetical protein
MAFENYFKLTQNVHILPIQCQSALLNCACYSDRLSRGFRCLGIADERTSEIVMNEDTGVEPVGGIRQLVPASPVFTDERKCFGMYRMWYILTSYNSLSDHWL